MTEEHYEYDPSQVSITNSVQSAPIQKEISDHVSGNSDSEMEIPEDSEETSMAITDTSILCFPKIRHKRGRKRHRMRMDPKLKAFINTHPFYIHAIIYRCSVEMLQGLIHYKPKNLEQILNCQDHHGNTALMLALKLAQSQREYINIVCILLEFGADPHIKDLNGWSVMDEAVAQKNTELVGILFDYFQIEKMKK